MKRDKQTQIKPKAFFIHRLNLTITEGPVWEDRPLALYTISDMIPSSTGYL